MSEIKTHYGKQEIGTWGETEAEKYFTKLGLKLIQKNYRTRFGEIDLIMQDGDEYVFVEVKTRTTPSFGFPEEAVNDEKIDHLTEAAEKYLETHPEIEEWRMDVLAIIGKPGMTNPQIEWYKNVE